MCSAYASAAHERQISNENGQLRAARSLPYHGRRDYLTDSLELISGPKLAKLLGFPLRTSVVGTTHLLPQNRARITALLAGAMRQPRD